MCTHGKDLYLLQTISGNSGEGEMPKPPAITSPSHNKLVTLEVIWQGEITAMHLDIPLWCPLSTMAKSSSAEPVSFLRSLRRVQHAFHFHFPSFQPLQPAPGDLKVNRSANPSKNDGAKALATFSKHLLSIKLLFMGATSYVQPLLLLLLLLQVTVAMLDGTDVALPGQLCPLQRQHLGSARLP